MMDQVSIENVTSHPSYDQADVQAFCLDQGLDLNKLTLNDRLKITINFKTKPSRRYADLEGISGIPSDHWKSYWHGKQRPTADMIEAVCRNWPIYALWITTGSCELKNNRATSGTQSKVECLARYLATLPETIIDALAVVLGVKLEG